jgi:putative transposase
LLLRNEYLAAENRILRAKIKGRLQLSEGEKSTLAEIARRLGRKVLAKVAVVARPILFCFGFAGWCRASLMVRHSDRSLADRGSTPRPKI